MRYLLSSCPPRFYTGTILDNFQVLFGFSKIEFRCRVYFFSPEGSWIKKRLISTDECISEAAKFPISLCGKYCMDIWCHKNGFVENKILVNQFWDEEEDIKLAKYSKYIQDCIDCPEIFDEETLTDLNDMKKEWDLDGRYMLDWGDEIWFLDGDVEST